MSDIVERLREGCGCNFPETTCMAESECADAFEAADEITRLRAENERLKEWNREIALNAREFVAENEKLRAALEGYACTCTGGECAEQAGYRDECGKPARAALEGKQ